MRSFCALLACLAAAIVLAPSASAQSRCVAPPGSSAVDQYCEVVPDGTGGRSGDGGGGGGGGGVSGKTAKQLEQAGAAGAAVLELSGGKAKKPNKKDGASGGSNAGSGSGSASALPDTDPGTKSTNVIEAAATSASDSARVGSGFIWVLLAGIAAVGGWGWISYRRRHSGTPASDS